MANPDRTAICPFYERESKNSVTCEGMRNRIHTALKFDDPLGKIRWVRKYCASYDYGQCPYAAAILKTKYGTGEENGTSASGTGDRGGGSAQHAR